MAKNKSPYPGYSLEEVEEMEKHYFCLVMGGDFILEDNHYTFTRSEIVKLYNLVLKDLVGIVKKGNDKDRKYALDLIAGLTVQQMRLH